MACAALRPAACLFLLYAASSPNSIAGARLELSSQAAVVASAEPEESRGWFGNLYDAAREVFGPVLQHGMIKDQVRNIAVSDDLEQSAIGKLRARLSRLSDKLSRLPPDADTLHLMVEIEEKSEALKKLGLKTAPSICASLERKSGTDIWWELSEDYKSSARFACQILRDLRSRIELKDFHIEDDVNDLNQHLHDWKTQCTALIEEDKTALVFDAIDALSRENVELLEEATRLRTAQAGHPIDVARAVRDELVALLEGADEATIDDIRPNLHRLGVELMALGTTPAEADPADELID